MPQPTHARLVANWSRGGPEEIIFKFNPTDIEFTRQVQIAEIGIPGLDAPLLQFIRGQGETLTLNLFFDSTEDGMGTGPGVKSVTEQIDKVYKLTKIDRNTHAPPTCRFVWNRFPGEDIGPPVEAQARTGFDCIVESVQHKYTLFSPRGVPLRATAIVRLREYKPLDRQLTQLGLNSPDKTQVRVLSNEETLSSIAEDHYRRPSEWRTIARANHIEDPRRLAPGTFITLPPLG